MAVVDTTTMPLPGMFDLDAECAAARARIHANIDKRFAVQRAVSRYGNPYQRSIGQTLRRLREKEAKQCRS